MKLNYGKVLYLKSSTTANDDKNNKEDLEACKELGELQEINSASENLIFFSYLNNKAYGISSNFNLLEWNLNKNNNNNNSNNNKSNTTTNTNPNDNTNTYASITRTYELFKSTPSFLFNKIKFKKLAFNETITIGLDIKGQLFVWGSSKLGCLGLGYKTTEVQSPTKLPLLENIKEISISDSHVVVINKSGDLFSWGTGNYGELCLENTCYSPFPTPMNNVTEYSRAYCSNYLTCLVDIDGFFSYFGVTIKIYSEEKYYITSKHLLKDESIQIDSETIFLEKEIIELENEKISQVTIGNGFIAILSNRGIVFLIDYSETIILLFSENPVISIANCGDGITGYTIEPQSKKVSLVKWEISFVNKDVKVGNISSFVYSIKDNVSCSVLRLLESNDYNNKEIFFMHVSDNCVININNSNIINNNNSNIKSNNSFFRKSILNNHNHNETLHSYYNNQILDYSNLEDNYEYEQENNNENTNTNKTDNHLKSKFNCTSLFTLDYELDDSNNIKYKKNIRYLERENKEKDQMNISSYTASNVNNNQQKNPNNNYSMFMQNTNMPGYYNSRRLRNHSLLGSQINSSTISNNFNNKMNMSAINHVPQIQNRFFPSSQRFNFQEESFQFATFNNNNLIEGFTSNNDEEGKVVDLNVSKNYNKENKLSPIHNKQKQLDNKDNLVTFNTDDEDNNDVHNDVNQNDNKNELSKGILLTPKKTKSQLIKDNSKYAYNNNQVNNKKNNQLKKRYKSTDYNYSDSDNIENSIKTDNNNKKGKHSKYSNFYTSNNKEELYRKKTLNLKFTPQDIISLQNKNKQFFFDNELKLNDSSKKKKISKKEINIEDNNSKNNENDNKNNGNKENRSFSGNKNIINNEDPDNDEIDNDIDNDNFIDNNEFSQIISPISSFKNLNKMKKQSFETDRHDFLISSKLSNISNNNAHNTNANINTKRPSSRVMKDSDLEFDSRDFNNFYSKSTKIVNNEKIKPLNLNKLTPNNNSKNNLIFFEENYNNNNIEAFLADNNASLLESNYLHELNKQKQIKSKLQSNNSNSNTSNKHLYINNDINREPSNSYSGFDTIRNLNVNTDIDNKGGSYKQDSSSQIQPKELQIRVKELKSIRNNIVNDDNNKPNVNSSSEFNTKTIKFKPQANKVYFNNDGVDDELKDDNIYDIEEFGTISGLKLKELLMSSHSDNTSTKLKDYMDTRSNNVNSTNKSLNNSEVNAFKLKESNDQYSTFNENSQNMFTTITRNNNNNENNENLGNNKTKQDTLDYTPEFKGFKSNFSNSNYKSPNNNNNNNIDINSLRTSFKDEDFVNFVRQNSKTITVDNIKSKASVKNYSRKQSTSTIKSNNIYVTNKSNKTNNTIKTDKSNKSKIKPEFSYDALPSLKVQLNINKCDINDANINDNELSKDFYYHSFSRNIISNNNVDNRLQDILNVEKFNSEEESIEYISRSKQENSNKNTLDKEFNIIKLQVDKQFSTLKNESIKKTSDNNNNSYNKNNNNIVKNFTEDKLYDGCLSYREDSNTKNKNNNKHSNDRNNTNNDNNISNVNRLSSNNSFFNNAVSEFNKFNFNTNSKLNDSHTNNISNSNNRSLRLKKRNSISDFNNFKLKCHKATSNREKTNSQFTNNTSRFKLNSSGNLVVNNKFNTTRELEKDSYKEIDNSSFIYPEFFDYSAANDDFSQLIQKNLRYNKDKNNTNSVSNIYSIKNPDKSKYIKRRSQSNKEISLLFKDKSNDKISNTDIDKAEKTDNVITTSNVKSEVLLKINSSNPNTIDKNSNSNTNNNYNPNSNSVNKSNKEKIKEKYMNLPLSRNTWNRNTNNSIITKNILPLDNTINLLEEINEENLSKSFTTENQFKSVESNINLKQKISRNGLRVNTNTSNSININNTNTINTNENLITHKNSIISNPNENKHEGKLEKRINYDNNDHIRIENLKTSTISSKSKTKLKERESCIDYNDNNDNNDNSISSKNNLNSKRSRKSKQDIEDKDIFGNVIVKRNTIGGVSSSDDDLSNISYNNKNNNSSYGLKYSKYDPNKHSKRNSVDISRDIKKETINNENCYNNDNKDNKEKKDIKDTSSLISNMKNMPSQLKKEILDLSTKYKGFLDEDEPMNLNKESLNKKTLPEKGAKVNEIVLTSNENRNYNNNGDVKNEDANKSKNNNDLIASSDNYLREYTFKDGFYDRKIQKTSSIKTITTNDNKNTDNTNYNKGNKTKSQDNIINMELITKPNVKLKARFNTDDLENQKLSKNKNRKDLINSKIDSSDKGETNNTNNNITEIFNDKRQNNISLYNDDAFNKTTHNQSLNSFNSSKQTLRYKRVNIFNNEIKKNSIESFSNHNYSNLNDYIANDNVFNEKIEINSMTNIKNNTLTISRKSSGKISQSSITENRYSSSPKSYINNNNKNNNNNIKTSNRESCGKKSVKAIPLYKNNFNGNIEDLIPEYFENNNNLEKRHPSSKNANTSNLNNKYSYIQNENENDFTKITNDSLNMNSLLNNINNIQIPNTDNNAKEISTSSFNKINNNNNNIKDRKNLSNNLSINANSPIKLRINPSFKTSEKNIHNKSNLEAFIYDNQSSYFSFFNKVNISTNLLKNLFELYYIKENFQLNEAQYAFSLIVDYSNSKIRKKLLKTKGMNFIPEKYTSKIKHDVSNEIENKFFYNKSLYIVKLIFRILLPKIKNLKLQLTQEFLNQKLPCQVIMQTKLKRIFSINKRKNKVELKEYFHSFLVLSKYHFLLKTIFTIMLKNLNKEMNFFNTISYKSRIIKIKKRFVRDFISTLCKDNRETKILKNKFFNLLYKKSLYIQRKPMICDMIGVFVSNIKESNKVFVYKRLIYYNAFLNMFKKNFIFFSEIFGFLTLQNKFFFFKKLNIISQHKAVLYKYINRKLLRAKAIKGKVFRRLKKNCEMTNKDIFKVIRIRKVYKIRANKEKLLYMKFLYKWILSINAGRKKPLDRIKYNVYNEFINKQIGFLKELERSHYDKDYKDNKDNCNISNNALNNSSNYNHLIESVQFRDDNNLLTGEKFSKNKFISKNALTSVNTSGYCNNISSVGMKLPNKNGNITKKKIGSLYKNVSLINSNNSNIKDNNKSLNNSMMLDISLNNLNNKNNLSRMSSNTALNKNSNNKIFKVNIKKDNHTNNNNETNKEIIEKENKTKISNNANNTVYTSNSKITRNMFNKQTQNSSNIDSGLNTNFQSQSNTRTSSRIYGNLESSQNKNNACIIKTKNNNISKLKKNLNISEVNNNNDINIKDIHSNSNYLPNKQNIENSNNCIIIEKLASKKEDLSRLYSLNNTVDFNNKPNLNIPTLNEESAKIEEAILPTNNITISKALHNINSNIGNNNNNNNSLVRTASKISNKNYGTITTNTDKLNPQTTKNKKSNSTLNFSEINNIHLDFKEIKSTTSFNNKNIYLQNYNNSQYPMSLSSIEESNNNSNMYNQIMTKTSNNKLFFSNNNQGYGEFKINMCFTKSQLQFPTALNSLINEDFWVRKQKEYFFKRSYLKSMSLKFIITSYIFRRIVQKRFFIIFLNNCYKSLSKVDIRNYKDSIKEHNKKNCNKNDYITSKPKQNCINISGFKDKRDILKSSSNANVVPTFNNIVEDNNSMSKIGNDKITVFIMLVKKSVLRSMMKGFNKFNIKAKEYSCKMVNRVFNKRRIYFELKFFKRCKTRFIIYLYSTYIYLLYFYCIYSSVIKKYIEVSLNCGK